MSYVKKNKLLCLCGPVSCGNVNCTDGEENGGVMKSTNDFLLGEKMLKENFKKKGKGKENPSPTFLLTVY